LSIRVIGSEGPFFIRSDSNQDRLLKLADAVFTLGSLFAGGRLSDCADAADANGDRTLNISDSVYTLGVLFLGVPNPPAPYPECGIDTSERSLGCAIDSGCLLDSTSPA